MAKFHYLEKVKRRILILKRGFTFVQILVIFVILAILVVVAVLLIKPSKILIRSRDAQRFADMKSLSEAINRYLADNYDFKGLVGPYSSIDVGFSSNAAREKNDGTGWLPLNFTSLSSGPPLKTLPLDPLNNISHNYRFGVSATAKTYEIEGVFESPDNIAKHSTDGGNNPNTYELGTDLTIL